jgi:hypothetical protein
MRNLLLATAAATALMATVSASALAGNDDEPRGGFDIGPLGQCFNPPDCGNKHSATYAHQCPLVRERIVTSNGNVIYRRHRICS